MYSPSFMRSIGVLLYITILFTAPAYALTDEQIVSQAIDLYQKGYSEKDIATTLLRNGATLNQLQTLGSQYSSTTGNMVSPTISSEATVGGARENTTITIANLAPTPRIASRIIFGHDIFSQAANTWEPQMNIATPQEYILGAGDQVIINIYGASQETFDATISPDGIITIAGYGPIHLSGLTIAAATRKLKSTLGSRYQNSQLMLSLGQSRTISVNVMGELQYPGNYQISAFANVLYALYVAGGINETGTLRAIKVYRNNKLVGTVDIYDYLLNGTTKNNVRLEDGDVILVGTYSGLVRIDGKVKRPIYYEMLPTETVHNLIYFAGGFAGDAYTDAVRIFRRSSTEGRGVHTVANAEFNAFYLADGDSVYVETILDRPQNTLEIQGAVFRPGYYGLSGNLHTIKQLVEMAQGPIERAIPERSVLYRMKADRTYDVIQVDVKAIIEGSAPDMELQNEDRLYMPSRQRQLDHFEVTIHGEVYNPGKFPYATNETVENLILRAGGLTDHAATSSVQIVRHLIDPSATEEVDENTVLFNVSLTDTVQVSSFYLEPYDEVYVRTTPAYAPNQNIAVRGEVVFDGTYALKSKTERISDMIAAAGGLTKYAYPEGARLIRHMNEEELRNKKQLLKINAAASSQDSVAIDKLNLDEYYYVAIDLAAALENPGGKEDFILRNGDVLIVPTITTTVRINGEVLYPNTVNFIQGQPASYYINQAGGYSRLARKTKAYVIYPNGRVCNASRAKMMPGSEIVVPSKPERQPASATQWVSIASATASLASVAATLATMIISLTK